MSHLIGNFSVLRSSRVFVLLTFFIAFCFGTNAQVPNEAEVIAAADKVMAAATSPKPAPGCAVGISLDSKSIYEKAFGMAELEHGIANTPQTIFESGSVAKQFVSASIILLSLEGKLKIDDPVRKYIPELPDYGRPLTIRHMLNHTSGLRDWGAVMGITGVGRGERIISQALAIDVVMQQRDVDFTPGSEYSYSNSGYQLLTEIVERVSKQSLPEFTKKRFFEPLVMTNSSWRTDYKTLVPGRAQAYAGRRNGPWQLSMPFMNVYGNGGMLTTVGDWLKWNKMLETRSMGAPLVEMMETNGILNDGRKITYALGIGVSEYKGLQQISHGGATAGYRTFLGRWPELKTSIAVLCNGSSMNPGGIARRIVDRVAPKLDSPAPPKTIQMTEAELAKFAGLWRNEKTHMPLQTEVRNGSLFAVGGGPLQPVAGNKFIARGGSIKLEFEIDSSSNPVAASLTQGNNKFRFLAETQWEPTANELKEFAGEWYSEESGAKVKILVKGLNLLITQRPDTKIPFMPKYKDHFTAGGGRQPVMWCSRDANGKISTLHLGAPRMRNMPFVRINK